MSANGIKINRITNANIYINGVTCLGKAEEVKLPDVNVVMQEHKALGMFGKLNFPAGIDKMEGEIKWNSFYEDVAKLMLSPFSMVQLQCRSNIETYDSQGLKQERPLVTFLNCLFTQNPLGTYTQQGNVAMTSKFTAYSVSQFCDGNEILVLDVMANIFMKNGLDLLSNYRKNI